MSAASSVLVAQWCEMILANLWHSNAANMRAAYITGGLSLTQGITTR
jgi:hypothetical protein